MQNAKKNRTTTNWVEEELSKFAIKKKKKKKKKKFTGETVKMSRLCKAGLSFFLFCFFFVTVNYRGPLPLRELHSTDETIAWRDPGGS